MTVLSVGHTQWCDVWSGRTTERWRVRDLSSCHSFMKQQQ